MPKVLVVDGEPSMRCTMAEALQRGGYDALAATDYASARECLAQHDIDAAVVALIRPRGQVIELLHQLHTKKKRIKIEFDNRKHFNKNKIKKINYLLHLPRVFHSQH